MALFKISRGLNGNLPIDKKDGYCYYTTDNSLFHIDYEDDNHELQRKSLNAAGAQKILVPVYGLDTEGNPTIIGYREDGAAVLALELDNSAKKIPTNALVSTAISDLTTELDTMNELKMDKENPVGTGSFSLNRAENSTIGENSVAVGFNTTSSGNYSFAEGSSTVASGENSHAGGEQSLALDNASFAHGCFITASGEAQVVFGKYNLEDNSKALIIGGGSGIEGAEDQYKNIFTVDQLGNAEFTGTVKALSPIDENDLATKAYVDAAASNSVDVGMSHMSLSATEDGQTEFDFSYYTGTTIDNNTLVYFNGLLLIKGVHYTLNQTAPAIVTLLDWSAKAGDYCHIVKFRVGEGGGVQLGGEATVTAASMLEGIKAYDNEGNLVEGTLNLDTEYENQVEVIDDIDALTQLEETLS